MIENSMRITRSVDHEPVKIYFRGRVADAAGTFSSDDETFLPKGVFDRLSVLRFTREGDLFKINHRLAKINEI